jgi:glycosyltransferase involved in cell wall biosynthesis
MPESKPKILHLITRLIDGGAEDELVQSVIGLRGEYEFAIGHGAAYTDTHRSTLVEHGIETIEFPLIRHYNPLTAIGAVGTVAWHLRRGEFDLIHTHSTEAGIIGRIGAQIAGVPAIHTVHGIPFTDDRSRVLNRFVLAGERIAARHSERIITNTPSIKQAYLDRDIGRPEQYTVIYSGIDIDSFRGASPATDLPGERPRVLMVARLTEGKGFEVLLETVEQLPETAFSVCIAGDGPMHDDLEGAITERDLEDKVHLLGYRDDIPEVMAASDVFVLPSFREGMPRVITEAMAAGLPVVATDIAGIPDQIDDGETGFLIPTGDSEALASSLGELLANSALRERFGVRGQEKAAEKFSIEETRERLRAEYEQLLE